MVDIATKLAGRVLQLANAKQQMRADTKRRLLQLEIEKAELEESFALAELAIDRRSAFKPKIGGIPQCPDCFMASGVQIAMHGISGDTEGAAKDDHWRCNKCGFNETDDG